MTAKVLCGGCNERIHRDPEGSWCRTAWAGLQPVYECVPPGYRHQHGTLFHAPEGEC